MTLFSVYSLQYKRMYVRRRRRHHRSNFAVRSSAPSSCPWHHCTAPNRFFARPLLKNLLSARLPYDDDDDDSTSTTTSAERYFIILRSPQNPLCLLRVVCNPFTRALVQPSPHPLPHTPCHPFGRSLSFSVCFLTTRTRSSTK